MTQTPALYQRNKNNMPGSNISNRSTHEIKQWFMLIALPMIGILLLLLCFLLQGIFAIIGPWVILIGVKLINRKVEKK